MACQKPKYEAGGLPGLPILAILPSLLASRPRQDEKEKTEVGVGRTELNPDLAATVLP